MIYGVVRVARECVRESPNLLLLNMGIWGLLWLGALDATIIGAMQSDLASGRPGLVSTWGKFVFTSGGVVVQLALAVAFACLVQFAICRGAYRQLFCEN